MRKRRSRSKLDDISWEPTPRRRRGTSFVHDDMTPEEIEKLFEQQEKDESKKTATKMMDPLWMASYIDDSTNTFEIEKRFALLDNETKKGLTSDEAARKVYIENATPAEIGDVDSWLYTDISWENKDSSEDDNFEVNGYGDDDDMNDIFSGRRKRGANLGKKIKISTFSDIFHLEKFGACIERWPIRKLARTIHISAEGLTQVANPDKMRNFVTIDNNEFSLPESVSKYHKLETIDGSIIKKMLKSVGNVDGIALDPPIGIGGYTTEDFTAFLREIIRTGINPYITIWVDPDTIEDVIDTANALNLDPCDSVVVELFDSLMEPIKFKTKLGFPQHSRMILLYRVKFSDRSSIAQQRIRDTGWGIVYPNGKSRGRYGMPNIANEILETLLPAKKKQRTFIEVWPSRYSLRPNWISFDEV